MDSLRGGIRLLSEMTPDCTVQVRRSPLRGRLPSNAFAFVLIAALRRSADHLATLAEMLRENTGFLSEKRDVDYSRHTRPSE